MSLRLCDPTSDMPTQEQQPAPRYQRLERLAIGLLANGKANSEGLLRETARLFVERHSCTVAVEATKPNPSRICDPTLLHNMAQRTDFLITGVGD